MSLLNLKSVQPTALGANGQNCLVEAHNLGVRYLVGSRREDLQSRAFDTLLRRSRQEEFWALRDVSLSARAGDILGIIGFNGAGKTTLCRVISGILRPDMGDIHVGGSVTALLALGPGYNNMLSGRENVFLNAMMLGFSREHTRELFQQIVEFSGLNDFIDQPLKNYSSGMKSRLAFSTAVMIEPEILIIDEALSAGDLDFSKRAGQKLQEIIGKSKAVIVVTHQMEFVEKYCTVGLWIDRGLVKANGQPHEVVKLYREYSQKRSRKRRAIDLPRTAHTSGASEVVKVRNVGVKFSLLASRTSGAGKTGEDSKLFVKRKKPFWPLRNISFSVAEGEIVGIIGRNGAGKTTLCKVLSGIIKADEGEISVAGKITALLTLGAGFNIQLTGKDNVYLNGMMLGITKKRLTELYSDIVDFAGLERSMGQPVKNYSHGMKSRLGFSVAAMIKPDVFIIDEILNVGDISFYEKATGKIQELMTEAKAVLVVTHNMSFVERVCTRAIWLEKGDLKFDGDPERAIAGYRSSVKQTKKI